MPPTLTDACYDASGLGPPAVGLGRATPFRPKSPRARRCRPQLRERWRGWGRAVVGHHALIYRGPRAPRGCLVRRRVCSRRGYHWSLRFGRRRSLETAFRQTRRRRVRLRRLRGGGRGGARCALCLDSVRFMPLARAPATSPAVLWPGGALRIPRCWWLPPFLDAVDVVVEQRAYLAHHDAQAHQC